MKLQFAQIPNDTGNTVMTNKLQNGGTITESLDGARAVRPWYARRAWVHIGGLIAVASVALTTAIPTARAVEMGVFPFPVSTPAEARAYGLESLKTQIEISGLPLPANLSVYIKDINAARQLGKAFFYEMAAGSDGVQACASCHFRAGADNRDKNQVSPGLLRRADVRNGDVLGYANAPAASDKSFEPPMGPNYTLRRDDFPLVRDISGGDNLLRSGSPVVALPGSSNRNDVISSQGVFYTHFRHTEAGSTVDEGTPIADPINNVRGINVRRVPPRNTPSTINALFNYSNFWDGRANNHFNGINPFGSQDVGAQVFRHNGFVVSAEKMDLRNASLASQAVGPPLSDMEMAFGGDGSFRIFPQLGRKLLSLRALATQAVSRDDSLLGPLRHASGKGLSASYDQLIRKAFRPEYLSSSLRVLIGSPKRIEVAADIFGISLGVVETNPTGFLDPSVSYTVTEANFAMIWGLSVMLYEATLIADESPFDRWMRGEPDIGFGPSELAGLNVFVGKGRCVSCHGGAEFSNASISRSHNSTELIETMVHGDGSPSLYDSGYYNIGVVPTLDDLGRGLHDPWGAPLSFARQFAVKATGLQPFTFPIQGAPVRGLRCSPYETSTGCPSHTLGFVDARSGSFVPVCIDRNGDGFCADNETLSLQRVSVDGAFKVPQLRNVADTAPYFHNGGVATLREVVEFYNRGGNFCRTNSADLDPNIQPLNLTDLEMDDLVSFLLALTDPRVAVRKAPFDAPELRVPNGHAGDSILIARKKSWNSFEAADLLQTIPAVGKNGGLALSPFLTTTLNLPYWQRQANAVQGGACATTISLAASRRSRAH